MCTLIVLGLSPFLGTSAAIGFEFQTVTVTCIFGDDKGFLLLPTRTLDGRTRIGAKGISDNLL